MKYYFMAPLRIMHMELSKLGNKDLKKCSHHTAINYVYIEKWCQNTESKAGMLDNVIK